MKVPVRKIQIAGGSSFTDTMIWTEGPYIFKVITAVTLGWPTVITAAAHGVPASVVIPAWIQNARGATALNTTVDTPVYIERITDDTLRLVNFNSGNQSVYVASSATIAFLLPKNLTGFTARGPLRKGSVTGAVLATPTYTITAALGKIVMTLTPTQTRALLDSGTSNTSGIAHIELVSGADVYRSWDYAWVCTPEATVES